jgi:hypothetical protein
MKRYFTFYLFLALIPATLAATNPGIYNSTDFMKIDKRGSSEEYLQFNITDNFKNVFSSGGTFAIKDFLLTENQTITINLKQVRNIFDSKTEFFKGHQRIAPPEIFTYTGVIEGQPDSKVLITMINGYLLGILESNIGNYYISPTKSNDGKYILSTDKYFDFPRKTNTADISLDYNQIMKIIEKYKADGRPMSNELLELELALETDTEFFKARGSNFDLVQAYIITLMTRVSMIYEQFIDVRIKLKWLKVWTDSPADPYNAKGDFAVLRDKAIQYWKDNYQNVDRDLYHVCTSVNYGGGGFGYFDALCGNKEFGMSVTSLQGWNNLASTDFSYDVYIIAHELGHNFNAQHTHSCFWNNAPLDTCVVDNACLPQGTQPKPNPGSIMSYCGGINNSSGLGYYVRMIFNDENVDIMRKTAEAAECLSPVSEPYVVLIEPDGGSVFDNISSVNVKWKAYNTDKINLYYSADDGISWQLIENGIDANSSAYFWNLPDICTSKLRLKISSNVNPNVADSSLSPMTLIRSDKDGFRAYYPFDGNFRDEQFCHFYNAESTNGVSFGGDRNSQPGASALFSGNNFLAANHFKSSFDEMTLTFWYYAETGEGPQHLVGTNWEQGWSFSVYLWGQLGASLYVNGNGAPDQIWGGNINVNKWTFVALTFDGTTAKLYNGTNKGGEKTWPAPAKLNSFGDTPLYIGARKDKEYFKGRIDDVRIYDRALTETELFALTGIDYQTPETKNQLSIYPNPAGEYISVNVGTGRDLSLPNEIRIYNILGQCVLVETTRWVVSDYGRRPTGTSLRIDTSTLPTGIYTLRCGNETKMFVKK